MGLFSWMKKHVGDIVDPVGAVIGTDNKYVNAARGVLEPVGALGTRRIAEGAQTGGLRGAIGGLSDAAAWGAGDFISPMYTQPSGDNPIYDRVGPIAAGYFGGPILGSIADQYASGSKYGDVGKLRLGGLTGMGSSIFGDTPWTGPLDKLMPKSSAAPTSNVNNVTSSGIGNNASSGSNINLFSQEPMTPSLWETSNPISPSVISNTPGNPAGLGISPITGGYNVPASSIVNNAANIASPILNSGASSLSPSTIKSVNPSTTQSTTPSTTSAPAPNAAGGFMNTLKQWGPAIGGNLLSSYNQSNMMEDLANAQNASYEKYLSAINPPQEVLDTRFNKAKSQVLASAPIARRRISDELASRGIRGAGLASPTASLEKDINSQINNAYFDIYGNYNVPQMAPPVNYAPGTGQLLGKNVGDLMTIYGMNQLYQ